jgi:Asp-tRNA(Asn)/Glu-tRNA(Gln) amidotransferase A subunit family amidase
MTDLCRLSAAELLDGYARRAFSPTEVTTSIFERIERFDGALHSFLAVDRDGAMNAARRAETAWLQAGEKPLLCGVPVNVKDTIDMAGFPTTYGSLAFKNNVQPDAEIVRRLRSAGAVILGKTNTPEFALSGVTANRLGPPTANPWDLRRSAGGSTGGGAAAVAAGFGPLCIGTDSAGSVRLPAAYQGIFALKPSFQRIPAVQPWRASPARSHNGPITRTVRDSALMMAALAGPHPSDPDSARHAPVDYLAFAAGNVRGARVAVSKDFGRGTALDPDQRHVFDRATDLLTQLGCVIVEDHPPAPTGSDELEPGMWAYSGDHYAAAESMIPNFWEKHGDDLTTYARPIYEAGRRALAWKYRAILRRDRAYGEAVRQWFSGYDFLLTPSNPQAPLLDAADAADSKRLFGFLGPFNHAYNPAASVPIGLSSDGMPLSVQVVGRLGDDCGVLRLAGLMEGLNPWALRWPSALEESQGRALETLHSV